MAGYSSSGAASCYATKVMKLYLDAASHPIGMCMLSVTPHLVALARLANGTKSFLPADLVMSVNAICTSISCNVCAAVKDGVQQCSSELMECSSDGWSAAVQQ
jgi:hypothetical protein